MGQSAGASIDNGTDRSGRLSGVSRFRPWLDAWVDCAYDAHGFWRENAPADHFRTASTSTPLLAMLLVDLLSRHPDIRTVVELGAGDGRLLSDLSTLKPELSLAGVDVRDRPGTLPAGATWACDLWDVRSSGWTSGAAEQLLGALSGPSLILCVEWLDDLPCPIAVWADGLRLVEVDRDGVERLGGAADSDSVAWASRWSPWSQRVEVGHTRDRAWAAACAQLRSHGGLVLLVDYGHLADRRPVDGSLTAYRRGRRLEPRPSPELNLTASVAVDSLAQAGHAAGASTLLQARQSDVVPVSALPVPGDPLADLVARSHRSALRSASVWGDQWWLLQQVPPCPTTGSGSGG